MAGIRIGGQAPPPILCSPPFGIQDTANNYNVYRACVGDAAGEATAITDFSDGATVVDGVHNPRLSPDGSRIVFEYQNTSNSFQEIWITSSSPGSTATQLVADASQSCVHPAWSPDGSTIVFIRGGSGGFSLPTNNTIETVPAAGGSPTVLKAQSVGFSPYRPQYNFDGTKIAYWYQQNIGGSDSLRCMNDDGTGDAAVDTGVGNYDNNNPQQFGWANAANMLCYDAGANAYVINSDGTGRVQINANGPAAGVPFNVTSDCWAPDDSYVVVTANLASGFGIDLIRAELDGSNTTRLNTSHGAENTAYYRGAFIYQNRIWFVEVSSTNNGGTISSTLLDGTDYRVDLNVNSAAVLNWLFAGDGFVYN